MIPEKVMEIKKFIKLLLFVLSLYMKPTSVSSSSRFGPSRGNPSPGIMLNPSPGIPRSRGNASSRDVGDVGCIETERQALLKFKHGLIISNEDANLSSWGSRKDKGECCQWDEVVCNEEGQVIQLVLDREISLRVELSPSLLELQHLNHLDLSGIDFGGSPIPNFLGSFKNLRYLKLAYSNFAGDVPCQLGNLTTLQTLDLSGNYGLRVKSLDWLSRLSSLSVLDLSYVDLSETNWLPQITKIPFLSVLKLSECQLHDTPSEIDIFINSSFSSLYHLDLSNNYLTSSSIFPWLFNFTRNATTIDLSYNQLSGPFPDITRFSNLYKLLLNNNQLRGFLPQSLGQPSTLKVLYLSDNQIGGKFLASLSVFSQLEGLYVDSNSLEDTITEDHFSNITQLRFLDLSFNSLALNMRSDWVPPFHLEALWLKHCNLGNHFPKWLQTQSNLHELDLSFAGISGTLPKWFWSMSSILMFNLSHNNIGGGISDFSEEFAFHNFIDLSYNNFSGPISSSVFHSTEVRLSNNMFSGSISHICGIYNSILILDLSDNQLSGELPDCWTNISGLTVLSLANNKFWGKIPYTMGSLDQLQTLHLRNNSLIGDLPSSLKDCSELRIIDLGENKLTGNIPPWIGTYLKKLTIISLRFNKFYGIIPSTICHLANIQILDLSRNNISGKILECLNNFTSLVQINSSTESTDVMVPNFQYDSCTVVLCTPGIFQLRRYIDNILVQWKGQVTEHGKLGLVKGIDLSSNKLVGTIPPQFSDMRGLIFLNLSRNHLTGNIISNIGQMELLEWLDLSRNQLSGEIPNSLALLHFLSVLDLSCNNLMGKIPLSTQLQSFNSSAYAGNDKLCGLPLVECPGDARGPIVTDHGNGNSVEEDHQFYICMTFGFITGFWAIVGTLYLKHSWRIAYFNFWINIGDWMYVTTKIYARRFKRKFQG